MTEPAEGRSRVARMARALLLYAVAPLALLALIEMGLRGCGVGESGRWLLKKNHEGFVFHAPSQAFYQQFTALPLEQIMNWDDLDFLMPAEKPAETIRIFAFGESALFGTRSAARMLEVMLGAAYPDRRFELFNASCPGMNSHVLRAAAQEAARQQPDLFLIYMGNNEAVGPFGPTTPIGRSRVLWNTFSIQHLIALNRLRLLQLLGHAMPRPAATPTDAQIAASIPGQAQHDKVNAMFRENVEAMIAAAHGADASVVLCTLGSNRRFGGEHVDAPANLNDIRRGGANEAILAVAREHEGKAFALADVERRLYERSPSGVPDYRYFTDNIHFTFEGSHEAACAMFEQAVRLLKLPTAQPLSLEDAALHLAWGKAARIALLRMQVDAGFDAHSKERLRAELNDLEKSTPADINAAMAQDFEKALALRPEDIYLLHGRFLAKLFSNDADAALDAARQMVEKHPHSRLALRAVAQALSAKHQANEAHEAYERVLSLYPDDKPSLASLTLRGAP